MLQIKNVSITQRKDLRELVSELSFCLNDGDKAAIIGEEGNGKSTLLKLIYNEKLIEEYAGYTGEIIRQGNVLGYLGQELSREEKETSVYEFLAGEPGFLEADTKELAGMAKELGLPLSLLYSEQLMDTLSGGEKIKVQFVRILCKKPDVLLLDEPSNDMDIETLDWLEHWINRWPGPVLFISHDETLLEHTANVIIHLEQIRRKQKPRHAVVKTGYEEYSHRRAASLEKQGQLARKERSEYRRQQEKFRRIEQRVHHEQEKVSRQNPHGAALLKKKMKAVKSLEHRFEREAREMTEFPDAEEAILLRLGRCGNIPAGKTVLNMELPGLQAGNTVLAENLSLWIRGPEKVCIVGNNGAGKTTLLKEIVRALSGREDICMAYMPQNYEEELPGEKTPVEFLCPMGDREERSRIQTFLGSLKFTYEEMGRPLRELSGGQKAKVFLLKMSISGAGVWLLDEPTRNLSPLSGPIIRKMLQSFPGTIISVSHDRKYMEEVCDTLYRLDGEGLHQIH
ncbi:MAG: ABC-F family ATP-binding cassette domain-containing protein [Lachnospiraceae bacterium]|nr:ABC-F family ATP-binding cassette domain-containing protein [Lachnospiraceae bacterium]